MPVCRASSPPFRPFPSFLRRQEPRRAAPQSHPSLASTTAFVFLSSLRGVAANGRSPRPYRVHAPGLVLRMRGAKRRGSCLRRNDEKGAGMTVWRCGNDGSEVGNSRTKLNYATVSQAR